MRLSGQQAARSYRMAAGVAGLCVRTGGNNAEFYSLYDRIHRTRISAASCVQKMCEPRVKNSLRLDERAKKNPTRGAAVVCLGAAGMLRTTGAVDRLFSLTQCSLLKPLPLIPHRHLQEFEVYI